MTNTHSSSTHSETELSETVLHRHATPAANADYHPNRSDLVSENMQRDIAIVLGPKDMNFVYLIALTSLINSATYAGKELPADRVEQLLIQREKSVSMRPEMGEAVQRIEAAIGIDMNDASPQDALDLSHANRDIAKALCSYIDTTVQLREATLKTRSRLRSTVESGLNQQAV